MSSFSSLSSLGWNSFNKEVVWFSVSHINEFSFRISDIVLSWSVDVVLRIFQKFNPVSNPSRYSWNCEEDRIHISWKSHSSINQPTIEVYIGIEFSADKVLIGQSYLLKFNSNFNQRLFSTNFKHLKGNLNHELCTFLIIFARGS